MPEMQIADAGVGIMVVVLGAFLVLAGIGMAVVILREGGRIEKMLMPLLSQPLPDFGLGQMIPMFQALIVTLLQRVFTYVRLLGLLGGPGLVVVGIVVIFLGIWLWT